MTTSVSAPQIQSVFDATTSTVTYIVHDGPGTVCAIIDPVLDYDPKSGRTRSISADKVVDFVTANELRVEWILETHAHADHLTAAPYLKGKLGGKIAIGHKITAVQQVFKQVFNLEPGFRVDGSQFDVLFEDDEVFHIGRLEARAMAVPGHTPACVAYQVGDAVFVGDTLFMPDVGTARCDFPGATQRRSTLPCTGSLACRPRRGSSCATTIRRRTGLSPSRPRSPRSAPPISMCAMASPRPNSSRCAPDAMRRWRCPCSSCLRCRSTSAQASARRRSPTASRTSRSRWMLSEGVTPATCRRRAIMSR